MDWPTYRIGMHQAMISVGWTEGHTSLSLPLAVNPQMPHRLRRQSDGPAALRHLALSEIKSLSWEPLA
jgi:hypothetical protein